MQKINIRRLIYIIRHKYLTLNNAVIVAAFLVAAGWVSGSLQMMERNYKLQKALDDKERQLIITQLDTESARLEQRYYQTEEYQELAAREKLGLAMPGERILMLPPNSQAVIDADKKAAERVLPEPEPVSNFSQWMNFLFGGNHNSLGN